MLTRNQKSKMVYDVKELKEYFDKRFNELKNSLGVNNNTAENFKSEIKSDWQKLEDKIDNKIKALESDKKLLQQHVTALDNKTKKPSNAMMSWNSTAEGSALELIVFLNRITKS